MKTFWISFKSENDIDSWNGIIEKTMFVFNNLFGTDDLPYGRQIFNCRISAKFCEKRIAGININVMDESIEKYKNAIPDFLKKIASGELLVQAILRDALYHLGISVSISSNM